MSRILEQLNKVSDRGEAENDRPEADVQYEQKASEPPVPVSTAPKESADRVSVKEKLARFKPPSRLASILATLKARLSNKVLRKVSVEKAPRKLGVLAIVGIVSVSFAGAALVIWKKSLLQSAPAPAPVQTTDPTVQAFLLVQESHAQGVAQYKSGNWQAAAETFEKVAKIRPNDPSVLANLGLCYMRMRNWEKATANFQKAQELNPESPVLHNNLGMLFMAMNRYEDAITAFLKAQALSDQYPDPYFNLGRAYELTQRWDLAIRSYQKFLSYKDARVQYAELLEKRMRKLRSYAQRALSSENKSSKNR